MIHHELFAGRSGMVLHYGGTPESYGAALDLGWQGLKTRERNRECFGALWSGLGTRLGDSRSRRLQESLCAWGSLEVVCK